MDVAKRNLVPVSAQIPKAMKPTVSEFQINLDYTRKDEGERLVYLPAFLQVHFV